jgi:hypothetical protein
MAASCRSLRGVLHRPPEALSGADRRALDEHLAGCRPCSEEAAILAAARAAVLRAPARPLGDAAVSRAIEGALEAAGRRIETAAPSRRWILVAAGAGLAAAAAILALRGDRLELGAGSEAPPAGDRVISGKVEVDGLARGEGEPIPGGLSVAAAAEAVLGLGPARVTLAPGSAVAWDGGARTLTLERGQLDVSVSKQPPARRFRVSAGDFVVEVVGTRFRVSPGGVDVVRGVVLVLDAATLAVLAEVGAGESWRPEPAPPSPAATELEPSRAEPVLEASPSRDRTAEARTVLAENAQAAGDTARAVRLYLEVARLYPDLRAGETALFAAARLQAATGETGAARATFHRYLRRHPAGRFADEARRHLRALGGHSDPYRGDP